MSDQVILTNSEFLVAAYCGVLRGIKSLSRNGKDRHGFDRSSGRFWDIQVEGACGEMAAAKAMGVFWSPTVDTFKAPDIGKIIQVRTLAGHEYDLWIRPSDDPAHRYILVTGRAPTFLVHGWIDGEDARRDEWWGNFDNDRPPLWRIPQTCLLPLSEITAGQAG